MTAPRITLETFRTRFWAKVGLPDERGCRLWQGYIRPDGYGEVSIPRNVRDQASWGKNSKDLSNRVVLFLTRGYWPLNALHTCDNPACCEVTHIYEGTKAENSRDMVVRDRMNPVHQVRGEKVNTAKLTVYKVLQIREQYRSGESKKKLAAIYGVTSRAITFIVERRNWKHVS